MIYRCKYCKNRHDCPENKEQYERTCKTIGDIARAIDELPDYHCYYSLSLRCDYWSEDIGAYIAEQESEGADNGLE